jgi:ZIP zinc/iron transport family
MEDTSRPTCGSGSPPEDYNLGLHIGGLFIILAVSATACALPLIALKVPALRIPSSALFGFRHFGTGVLLATAFVHLFPTAFLNLTDPCLPEFFTDTYPAFAGAVALAAVFLITIIEMVFSPGRSLCSGGASGDHEAEAATASAEPRRNQEVSGDEMHAQTTTPTFNRTRSGRSHRTSVISIPPAATRLEPPTSKEEPQQNARNSTVTTSSYELFKPTPAQERNQLIMQCTLLECGILFHSVFIGMALAVATGHDQIVLLIAIAFHQTFEGLALGSRIAAIGWQKGAIQPWVMALVYGCTTPIGQAIGISTRQLYDPESQFGLILVGTTNAISAGLLAYTSLVDLLSEDFLSDRSWRVLRGKRRVAAAVLVGAGAFCMALIGAWA